MAKTGKNLHLEHLEDEIINKGAQGGKEVIDVLKELGNYMTGFPGANVAITTKWDGAPAVICGTDPADGQFFVGTKSVFATTQPKICKSKNDIARFYDGELSAKLMASFDVLSRCNIKGVLQGDLMFTGDQKVQTINGERLISFKPNTIVYAAPVNTPLGKDIQNAKLGIVFHTKYTGDSLPNMKSSFDIKDSDYRASSDAWIQKAEFKDIGAAASFTPSEKQSFDSAVNRAEGSLKQASSALNMIQSGKKALQLDTEFKKFFNNYVKAGQNVPPVEKATKDFIQHLQNEYTKKMHMMKSEKGKLDKMAQLDALMAKVNQNMKGIKMIIASYMNIQFCKHMLVRKLEQVKTLRMFARQGNTYKVTVPEGFVAISGRRAVKLIDRLEFSNLNFQTGKPGS